MVHCQTDHLAKARRTRGEAANGFGFGRTVGSEQSRCSLKKEKWSGCCDDDDDYDGGCERSGQASQTVGRTGDPFLYYESGGRGVCMCEYRVATV